MKSKDQSQGSLLRLALASAAIVSLGTAAHAITYNEGPAITNPITGAISEPFDLSNSGSSPTSFGAQTLGSDGTLSFGSNHLIGATDPYGPQAGPGLANQDNDYVTFTVPTGDVLASIKLDPTGSSIVPGDQFFIAIAKGSTVSTVFPPTSGPPNSSGLLGYTLVSSSDIGSTNILAALGVSNPAGFPLSDFPGATTFSGPLPAGAYSVWLLDGDNSVSYNLDFQVASAAPEPSSWALLLAGVSGTGLLLRRRNRLSLSQGAARAV